MVSFDTAEILPRDDTDPEKHRMSSESSECDERGVHGGLGNLQSRLSLPLHIQMVENSTSLSTGQPGMGISEIWTIDELRDACIGDSFGRLYKV